MGRYRNSEGYDDPTEGLALRNVSRWEREHKKKKSLCWRRNSASRKAAQRTNRCREENK